MNVAEYARMRDLEDWYWWFVARRAAAAKFAAHAAPKRSPLRILDAGCGTGAMLDEFKKWGDVELTGLDISDEAIRYTRTRGHDNLVQGDLSGLPFPDGSFDMVTSLDVIEHVPDDQRAIHELARVLAPGGVLVTTVPAYQFLWSSHDEAVHHLRRYTGRRFRRLFEDSDLEVEKQTYLLSTLLPVAAVARLTRARRDSDKAPPETQVPKVPPLINKALIKLNDLEVGVARRVPLPFGLSNLVVARKPDRDNGRHAA